jgi:hypothetical protein
MSDQNGYVGQQGAYDSASFFHSIKFLIRQLIGHVRTGVPVKVIAVHGGGVGPPPTVDVQPVVNQIDGTVYGLQTTRNHGGTSAVINDPAVGDVGYVVVADRDISSLKANSGQISNPGSFRRHDLADGVYVGKLLDPKAPKNYIQHLPSGGFHIHDQFGNDILMNGNGITITTTLLQVNGPIQATGEIVAKNTSTNIHVTTHTPAGGPPPDPGS